MLRFWLRFHLLLHPVPQLVILLGNHDDLRNIVKECPDWNLGGPPKKSSKDFTKFFNFIFANIHQFYLDQQSHQHGDLPLLGSLRHQVDLYIGQGLFKLHCDLQRWVLELPPGNCHFPISLQKQVEGRQRLPPEPVQLQGEHHRDLPVHISFQYAGHLPHFFCYLPRFNSGLRSL